MEWAWPDPSQKVHGEAGLPRSAKARAAEARAPWAFPPPSGAATHAAAGHARKNLKPGGGAESLSPRGKSALWPDPLATAHQTQAGCPCPTHFLGGLQASNEELAF